jgi:hypothetical protein
MPELLSALVDWWVAAAPRAIGPVYPIVSAAHILSLALLVGAVATLDFRLLGAFPGTPVAHLAEPLTRVAGGGLMLAVLTGFLLFSVQPGHYLGNAAFLAKMAILAVGVLNVWFVRALPRRLQQLRGQPVPARLRAAAAISLVVWGSAVLAGRWIAFL